MRSSRFITGTISTSASSSIQNGSAPVRAPGTAAAARTGSRRATPHPQGPTATRALCNDVSMPRRVQGPVSTVDGADPREVVDAVVRASRALVGVAARSVAGFEEEITLAQYRMLVLLCARGPQRVADLAQALGVTPSTATRMTDRLVRKHLARRHRTTTDRRSVRVGVTPTGRALVDEVTARRRQEIARIVAAMAPDRRALLVDALRAFAEAAGEVPDQSWSAGWE